MFRVIRLLSRQGWRKSFRNEANPHLRRNAENSERPGLVLLCLLGSVLRCSSPGSAPAEVFSFLLPRGDLRSLLFGTDRLRSSASLQPQSAGGVGFCRKALHHQTREGLRKASEIAMISRPVLPAVTCLSVEEIVEHRRNFAAYAFCLNYLLYLCTKIYKK